MGAAGGGRVLCRHPWRQRQLAARPLCDSRCPSSLPSSPQRSGAVQLVSRYGEEMRGAEVPLFFHGGGHYDLLVLQPAAAPAEQQSAEGQPRSRL